MNKKGAITLINIIWTVIVLIGFVAFMPTIYLLIEQLMPSCPPSVQLFLSLLCPVMVLSIFVYNLQQGSNYGGY